MALSSCVVYEVVDVQYDVLCGFHGWWIVATNFNYNKYYAQVCDMYLSLFLITSGHKFS
jgi:hypothetical protein